MGSYPLSLEVLAERIAALERLTEAQLKGAESATELARETLNARLEAMNELRNQLNTQALTLVSKSEYDTNYRLFEERLIAVDKRVQGVELLKADITGRIWTLGVVIGIVVVVMEFILHFVVRTNIPK